MSAAEVGVVAQDFLELAKRAHDEAKRLEIEMNRYYAEARAWEQAATHLVLKSKEVPS